MDSSGTIMKKRIALFQMLSIDLMTVNKMRKGEVPG